MPIISSWSNSLRGKIIVVVQTLLLTTNSGYCWAGESTSFITNRTSTLKKIGILLDFSETKAHIKWTFGSTPALISDPRPLTLTISGPFTNNDVANRLFKSVKSAELEEMKVKKFLVINTRTQFTLVAESKNNQAISEATDAFMKKLQGAIKIAWHPAKADESKRVSVQFTLDHSGKISNAKILQSSGSTEADNAALLALVNTKPVTMPSIMPRTVDIQFTFDYNVFKEAQKDTASAALAVPSAIKKSKAPAKNASLGAEEKWTYVPKHTFDDDGNIIPTPPTAAETEWKKVPETMQMDD